MIHLLDVNVLIALADRYHANHDIAHQWLSETAKGKWATCAITENGLVRIVSNPRYPNSAHSPALMVAMLAMLRRMEGHVFWPDNISLLEDKIFRIEQVSSHRQITDIYLLGLARSHEGRFATFDRHIKTDAVIDGKEALCVIET